MQGYLLNESLCSCRDDTAVNDVIRLNNDALSLWDGRLQNWVKIVSLISPLIGNLIQENIVLDFWMALLLVQEVMEVVISASVMEW